MGVGVSCWGVRVSFWGVWGGFWGGEGRFWGSVSLGARWEGDASLEVEVVLWLVPQDISLVLHLTRVCDDDSTADLVGRLETGRTCLLEELRLEIHVGVGNCRHGRLKSFPRDVPRRD